jgi:hypothetical protein
MQKVCNICYENKEDFWKCSVCQNDHCFGCHDEIESRAPKCPFCRTSFNPLLSECRDLVTYSVPFGMDNTLTYVYRVPVRYIEHYHLLQRITTILYNEMYDDDDDW